MTNLLGMANFNTDRPDVGAKCPSSREGSTLSDGRVISSLVTDANWHAIRAYRERNCMSTVSPTHWNVVNLCNRALLDYSDHDAWAEAVEIISAET